MTDAVPISLDAVTPSIGDALRRQGVPPEATVKDTIADLAETSLRIFSSEARPRCVISDISGDEFDDIFRGEGRNDDEAPLRAIYPQAEHLALFALTMGQELSEKIEASFRSNDFALGSMLDSVASLAVEKSVGLLERHIARRRAGTAPDDGVTLNYSPGYCGWHITAQRKIFQRLRPEQVGITLNDSCLMTPLKSATGVLVHGVRAIHHFDIGFSFCRMCKDHSCLERHAGLAAGSPSTQ